jgi:hypothetical protein
MSRSKNNLIKKQRRAPPDLKEYFIYKLTIPCINNFAEKEFTVILNHKTHLI